MHNMRKFILAITAITAMATLAVPALASASVQRYQTETATLTTTLTGLDLVHKFEVTINPCTNTFEGTGSSYQAAFGGLHQEKINGTLNADGTVSFESAYQNDSTYPGYQWGVNNASVNGTTATDLWDTMQEQGVQTVSTLHVDSTTQYKNHGDYVSSVGGGSDAAHSCIGMPINSSN
jgi:hypothetical protein